MKTKFLAIFKYPRAWNVDVINRFSNYYDVESLYISDYKNKNFSEIIYEINNLIESKKIKTVLFDVDYFKFINFFFIEKIKCKIKILVTGDDFDQHEMHSITASACNIILSHCPFSVLKYKEKGYEAFPISFEISNLKDEKEKKEIDVLFFGVLTSDRNNFLDHIISNGIKLKNVGHKEHEVGLSKDELVKLISKSKIILNLSKSRTIKVKNLSSESIYRFYYQFKGRILLAGLKGVLCVSEYSPGQELIFDENEIPTFYTKEECVQILIKLLKNDELLQQYTNQFASKINKLWDDKKSFEPIYDAIERSSHRRVKLIKFPYWYLRIAAKQIMLKNIKLSTLIKAIFQFKAIFPIIRKSNLLVKLLIIFESIINLFWYSLIFTFRSKK